MRFNAFGRGCNPEAFAEAGHGADDGHGIIARGQLLHERTIILIFERKLRSS